MRVAIIICAAFCMSGAQANEQSRLFNNCLAGRIAANYAATLSGDPNDAMDTAAEWVQSSGMAEDLSGMAALVEAQFLETSSAEEQAAFRDWLKLIADSIADEPIEKYRKGARATARAFEDCVMHVYDFDLTGMPGWQDTN